ncbi:hypothetical protein KIW84_011492 [Lathyrus oleraceus]|uniref:Uncharacterized protein n=1 Tax=Pisum sativum TaxID=3888 RepID=A0A9D5BF20_PEA|nr:hypothetical protein KIW84_011492 [Pisum sativum]
MLKLNLCETAIDGHSDDAGSDKDGTGSDDEVIFLCKSSAFERALEFKNLSAFFESEAKFEESRPSARLMEVFTRMYERLLSFLSRGWLLNLGACHF